MYLNFRYEKFPGKLTGYLWDVPGAKRVMCVIHGIGEYAGRYDRMAGILNSAGIAVVGTDLPGHGLSYGKRGDAAPRAEVFGAVEAMMEWAAHKYPDAEMTLYGHSMGGNICLDYRRRGRLNGMPCKYIVSAPWLILVRSYSGFAYSMVKLAARIAPLASVSSSCSPEDLGNMELVSSYATDELVHDRISLRCAVDCFDTGKVLCAGAAPGDAEVDGKPFLLMHGSEDRICSIEGSRRVAAQYAGRPDFTFIEWPGYYHEIHNGGPEADGSMVIATIRDFILADRASRLSDC